MQRLEELRAEIGSRRLLALALHERKLRQTRASFKGPNGLLNYIRYFWHVLEPGRPFVEGWALGSMCKHLQAVSYGEIRRLLINVPPGSMKSLLVNVFWPSWEWSALERPDLRYISFSYASHLTWRDNQKFLDLISSREFQELYGNRFDLKDASRTKVGNSKTGWKFATSVGGVGTGERGDRVMLDDPHNVKESESDVVRQETVRWFKEAMSNRLNDMDKSAIIVIMQRVHEDDVSGAILADQLGYVHLCIPLEFEPDRRCITYVGGKLFWADPRTMEGQCFWPERFPPIAMAEIRLLGEHAYAGQYQQRPEPRGGGLIKREYWRRWTLEEVGGRLKWPHFHYIVLSADTAFTDKEQNDPCGFTAWGAFVDHNGNACALTINAWRKHLKFSGTVRPREKEEKLEHYKNETSADWGLIQWLDYECQRWNAHKLLIEDKASGHDVASEMIRLFAYGKFVVELVPAGKMDKFARGVRIQPCFAEGLIYTLDEKYDRKWSKGLIDEMAIFPRGRFDDQYDSACHAIWHMRQAGFLVMAEERKQELIRAETYKRVLQPLYPGSN